MALRRNIPAWGENTMSNNGFKKQIADITRRADEMRAVIFDPALDDKGLYIADISKRKALLKAAIKNSVYESAGEHAEMIVGSHSRALQMYMNRFKRLPSDELLASCHKAIENTFSLSHSSELKKGIGVLEGADMSTTEGIMMRDRMVSLILPVLLQSVTSQMVTLIPGNFNRSEMFRVKRVAGSTFGDLKKGDRIDYDYNGRYAVMDQMILAGTGDGTAKEFTFNSATSFGGVYPLKPGCVKVLYDRNIVGHDDQNGHVLGALVLGKGADAETITVTGSVDYALGKVTVTFNTAPKAGIEVHIGYDVNIERDPTLIPRIDHQMESRVLVPHESAIAGNVTLQALWGLRREFGVDADNLAMSGMRNLLAADKDRKILRDLYFYAQGVVEWEYDGNDAITQREHYETLNSALLDIDAALMTRNGVSGLVGLVGDTNAVNVFRYLPAPYFVPAPGYRSMPQPHYVGRVFGQWDLYCDPNQEAFTCLAFARGTEHGQTGYVAGDAIPALTFRHPVLGDLVTSSTMWDLAYRDLQPFDGRDYLMTLKMVPGKKVAAEAGGGGADEVVEKGEEEGGDDEN